MKGGSSSCSRRLHQPGNELACSRRAHTYSMYHYPIFFFSTSIRTCVRYCSLSSHGVNSAFSFVVNSLFPLWIRKKNPVILVRVLLSDRRIGVRPITIRHYRHSGIWGFCHLAPFLLLLPWDYVQSFRQWKLGCVCSYGVSVGLGCGYQRLLFVYMPVMNSAGE